MIEFSLRSFDLVIPQLSSVPEGGDAMKPIHTPGRECPKHVTIISSVGQTVWLLCSQCISASLAPLR
jgi:hypothetical protein